MKLVLVILFLFPCLFLSLVIGQVHLNWTDVFHHSDGISTIIFWNVRLPRTLLAFMIGSGLALAGACYQGLLRNPLADPYILGVSSGASADRKSVV